MIFDRKKSDVNTAKNLILSKVQKGTALTADETATLEKGTLTINTLNRIENKHAELATLLSNVGYYSEPITTKTWNYSGLFTSNEFDRIINNTEILRKSALIYESTPNTPSPDYYYENINAIEKILHDIESMVEEIKSLFLECGTFECGEFV